MSQRNQKNVPPSDEILKGFLKNQSENLRLKEQENELRKEELKSSHEYAMQAVKLQAENLKHQRESGREVARWVVGGIIAVILLVLGFFTFSIYSGHPEVVKDIVEKAFYALLGGGGGYGIGRIHQKNINKSELNAPSAEEVQ